MKKRAALGLVFCLGLCFQARGQGGIVTTVAGNGVAGLAGDGGPATAASLRFPCGTAVDGSGNVFIADQSNNRIRRVSAGGIITTFVGAGGAPGFGDGGPAASAYLSLPSGVALDASGNLFIADTGDYRIRKVSATGTITTVAGSGNYGFSGDGGPATLASLASPRAVAVDGSGNLFIVDSDNGRIRKVSTGGIITTVAGNGVAGYSGDGGPATAAALNGPSGVAVDASGNLFIADVFNRRVRKVSAGGIITTIAGNGNFEIGSEGDGGPASAATLSLPSGVAVDTTGDLFIADLGAGRIRKISASGIITAVAGDGNQGFSGDNGPAILGAFNGPYSVAIDASGDLFIADSSNNRVREVSASTSPDTVENLVFTGTATCTDSFCSKYGTGPITGTYSLDVSSQAIVGPWSFSTPFGVISSTSAGAMAFVYVESSGDIEPTFEVSTSSLLEDVFFRFPGTNSQELGPLATNEGSYGCVNIPGGETGQAACDPDYILTGSSTLAAQPGGPAIAPGGVVPVDGTASTIQPGEWVSIFGTNLASSTAAWTGNFPLSLGGTSVTIDGRPAYLSYVSPTQINLQAPNDTALGPVPVVVTAATGSAAATVTLAQFGPSFLLLDSKHVAGLILRSNGSGAYGGGTYDILGPTGSSLGYPTVAAKAGDSIELFAVGLGPTSPSVPAGQAFSGAARTTYPVELLIDNVGFTPAFAGLSGAGLYQINLTLPAGLGTGDVPLSASMGGVQTPSGVAISVQTAPATPKVQSVTLTAASVTSGGTITGTVVLSGPAPAGGVVVVLTSSSSAVGVPATVTIATGALSTVFTASAGTVSANQTVTITASYGGTSAQVSLTVGPPPNSQCTNIGGSWIASESGSLTETIAATAETDSETDPVSGAGDVTITQTGCSIQYDPIGESGLIGTSLTPSQIASLARTGTVSGNNVTVTGLLALIDTVASAQAGFTITAVSKNLLTGTGQATGNTMTIDETGDLVVSGTYSINGQTGSFTETVTSSTTATFNWPAGVRPASSKPPPLPLSVSIRPDRTGLASATQSLATQETVLAVLRAGLRRALVFGRR